MPGEEDLNTIATMTAEYPDVMPSAVPTSWVDVFEQIGFCRVLITGSYHAGVFALAQGVPSICVAQSQYYVDKFVGLADQFGEGCRVIQLQESGGYALGLSTPWLTYGTTRMSCGRRSWRRPRRRLH